MPSIPPRPNRVLQTVDALKQEILTGRLQDKLPGERELAKLLQVSRSTLILALNQLEQELWISPVEALKRRKV